MDWFQTFNPDFLAHFESHYPLAHRLEKAIKYALASPGKRLRPRFVKESSDLVGLASEPAALCAFAVELVHLFSLVHDDLPCLDNDDLRRGQATLHRKFDEATALLAGDALLNFAFETFAGIAPHVDSKSFGNALLFFTRMIGSEGMIGGQSRELELGQKELTLWTQDLTLAALIRIQEQKTGALFQAALLTPFVLKGVPETDALFQEVKRYAQAFGFAFQIADDLEDEIQDQQNSAKNILSVMGKAGAIELAREQLLKSEIHAQYSATQLLLEKLK